jgi:hypothetical protein
MNVCSPQESRHSSYFPDVPNHDRCAKMGNFIPDVQRAGDVA